MKTSNAKQKKQFQLGYRLAFQTRSRKKDWKDIFALWYCSAKAQLQTIVKKNNNIFKTFSKNFS